jgi:hypothetical protein
LTYFARFEEIDGDLYRFDTRIYLTDGSPSEESSCIGAVIGINPGSARPKKLSEHCELELRKDKLLPYVRNRFVAAHRELGTVVSRGAYVQVLNLFYLCNQDLNQALNRLRELKEPPVCPSEKLNFQLAWYAWGCESELLAPLKQRFLARRDQNPFYMKRDRVSFGGGVPGPMEFAKHTRCMPAEPVEGKLVSILGALVANNSL